MTGKIIKWNIFTGIIILFLVISNEVYAENKRDVQTSGDVMFLLPTAIAYTATFYLDDQEGRRQLYKSFFLNLGLTYGLKLSINKTRPDDSGNDSFPSAHTSTAFQGATFIHKRYGQKYVIPAYIVAAYVGWSRVESDKHYMIDVISGSAIGILSSYFFTTPNRKASVTPIAENGLYGLHIEMKW